MVDNLEIIIHEKEDQQIHTQKESLIFQKYPCSVQSDQLYGLMFFFFSFFTWKLVEKSTRIYLSQQIIKFFEEQPFQIKNKNINIHQDQAKAFPLPSVNLKLNFGLNRPRKSTENCLLSRLILQILAHFIFETIIKRKVYYSYQTRHKNMIIQFCLLQSFTSHLLGLNLASSVKISQQSNHFWKNQYFVIKFFVNYNNLFRIFTMATIINLIDDQPKKQQINFVQLAESLINSIWSILRKNWTLHKYYVNDFETKPSPSSYCLKFSFTSIQNGILKIFAVVHIYLAYQIRMTIHSNIGSEYRQIIKVFPELQNSIMELKTRKKASFNLFDFALKQNGINTIESSAHNINLTSREFAKIVFQKLKYSESICQKMVEQLTKKQEYEFSVLLKKREDKAVKVHKDLALVEKENQRFKQFYKKEKNGQSVLKNPNIIGKKRHQIVRSLRFNQEVPVKQITLACYDQNRYKGGYSDIYYIKHRAEIFDTIVWHRERRWEIPQNRPLGNNQNQQTCVVIKKVPTQNTNRRIDAERSITNENYFLAKILCNENSPFMCNFYLNLEIPRSNLQPIYSDFHRQNASEIFFSDFSFTMLDMLNFTQQLVIALITQYLDKGFLHRDIKSGNILMSRGVIQIIDNGSVYPFDTLIKIQAMQRHKDHLDSELRTTYKIKEIEFIKSQRLIAKYQSNFSNFEKLNSRHRTFDVYAAGRMLKEIIQAYESKFSPKWMEISVTWHRLIERMTQKDFQIRIQMENVLQQVRNIRTRIFGIDQNQNI